MSRPIATLRDRFATLDKTFQERPIRERAILGIGFVALLFLALDTLLVQPVEAELRRADQLSSATRLEIEELEAKRATLDRAESSPQEIARLERRRLIEEDLASVDREIAQEIAELVPPEDVVSVLEEMLRPGDGLRLIRVVSDTPHRVGSGAMEDSEADVLDAAKRLYRHGMRIEIVGDFASTLDYLRRVEASRWHLLWDRLDYEVDDYPRARVTIDLHTISEVEEWIGV